MLKIKFYYSKLINLKTSSQSREDSTARKEENSLASQGTFTQKNLQYNGLVSSMPKVQF